MKILTTEPFGRTTFSLPSRALFVLDVTRLVDDVVMLTGIAGNLSCVAGDLYTGHFFVAPNMG